MPTVVPPTELEVCGVGSTPNKGAAREAFRKFILAYHNLFGTTGTTTGALDTLGLTADTGASLIGFKQSGTGAVSRTLEGKNQDTVSVFDFMTPAQIADVKAGTVLVDVTAAIQTAISSFPLNTANVGILAPLGFANGGTLHFPKGRYKVTAKLILQRGINIVGDSRESSQIISFTSGSVFEYLDAGRFTQDEIVFRNLSIWQDDSVAATSGAAIYVTDGPSTVDSVTVIIDNVLTRKTYRGVHLSAVVAGGIQYCNFLASVSDGVLLDAVTLSTSVTFLSCYSNQSQTGSGFKLINSDYCQFVACASDVNARYG